MITVVKEACHHGMSPVIPALSHPIGSLKHQTVAVINNMLGQSIHHSSGGLFFHFIAFDDRFKFVNFLLTKIETGREV